MLLLLFIEHDNYPVTGLCQICHYIGTQQIIMILLIINLSLLEPVHNLDMTEILLLY